MQNNLLQGTLLDDCMSSLDINKIAIVSTQKKNTYKIKNVIWFQNKFIYILYNNIGKLLHTYILVVKCGQYI